MFTTETQANEVGKDTNVQKLGQSRLKIRIRLPPRKRLSGGTEIRSTGIPEDSENLTEKNVPGQTDIQNTSTTCTAAEVKDEEASSNLQVPEDTKKLSAKEVPKQIDNNTRSELSMASELMIEKLNSDQLGERLCKEANNSNGSEILSTDTPPELVSFISPRQNPATDNEVQGEEENCHETMRLSEEGNKKLGKELSPENSCSTPIKELCTADTIKTPDKNPARTGVYGEVETNCSGTGPREDASNNVLKNRLLCKTNCNMSSKCLSEEATIKCLSKNLTISALKCEEASDNSLGTSLFEARNYMATEKLSTEAQNSVPSKVPAFPANDKTPKKRPCNSMVHSTHTCKKTSRMKPFPSIGQDVEQSSSAADVEAVKVYKEFEEKVRRTVYLDNLSHLTAKSVIEMTLNQFGTVRNVDFLINYTVPYNIPQSALVEMETEKDVESVVSMLHEFPFMMSGMPRPVRAQRATAVMFNDRPRRPGGKLEFRWVGPSDPDYQNVRNFKLMSKRHEVENLALIRLELEGEELLAMKQQENLNCNHRKAETLDSVLMTGWAGHLSRIYNMKLDEAF